MIRAAQYVRMSTEHQKYSTENQSDAIAAYAATHGMTIVRTYADAGKSGLRVDGREALKRLIADVENGRADFGAILVFDVSRWGRFQDTDESAYYEFICKEAGIKVHYCAEQFENDGSLAATIIKNMKRAMAGEYSRDLSAKVSAGQRRLATLGFRQGGAPGYGLQRQLIDECRTPKMNLHRGEHKSLQTDRVILVPGPPEEVATVERIYRLFVLKRMPEAEIAALLNGEGITSDLGRPWTRGTIHQILSNEKYIGNNVYNRISFKLKQQRTVNDPSTWVRADGAFAAIIDSDFFEAAQRIIAERTKRLSDQEMLDRLGHLLEQKGWLSGLVIDEVEDMPSSSAYRSRFGSLIRAYQLIGFAPSRDYRYVEINRALRTMYPDIVSEATQRIESLAGTVVCDPLTDLLTVNDEFTASVVIARCLRTSGGNLRWKIRIDASLQADITVAIRMDENNLEALDYYLLPRIDVDGRLLKLDEDNGIYLDAYRCESMDPFYALGARADIGDAA
jgi:DNA invertase Pin-like site-specific DNA recombinase